MNNPPPRTNTSGNYLLFPPPYDGHFWEDGAPTQENRASYTIPTLALGSLFALSCLCLWLNYGPSLSKKEPTPPLTQEQRQIQRPTSDLSFIFK